MERNVSESDRGIDDCNLSEEQAHAPPPHQHTQLVHWRCLCREERYFRVRKIGKRKKGMVFDKNALWKLLKSSDCHTDGPDISAGCSGMI